MQVYSNAQTQKSNMEQEMSVQLYDKIQDSQEGVVTAIMEARAGWAARGAWSLHERAGGYRLVPSVEAA